MAAPSRNPKQSSRWGSFLQQAVAGVESRLDTILAEGENPPGTGASTVENVKREGAVSRGAAGATPSEERPENGLSRTASNSRTHSRLQGRLAKAMVKNNNSNLALGTDSPTSTSGIPSRTASPAAATNNQRTSVDYNATDAEVAEAGARSSAELSVHGQSDTFEATGKSGKEGEQIQSPSPDISISREPSVASRQSMESQSSMPSRQSIESSRLGINTQTDQPHTNGPRSGTQSAEDYEPLISQLRSDFKVAEVRRQEETHAYLERIDALQAKLQYLTNEATEAARKSTTLASPGSTEKKLAEKDEQIALLMEEGEKLSKTELKHMNTIKKLRSKQAEDEKNIFEMKRKQERAERAVSDVQERSKRAEAAERRANERLKTLSKIETDIEALKSERDSTNALVTSLRTQLAQSASKLDEAEKKAQTNALEAEKRLVVELRDDLSSARIEKELSEERLKGEIRDLKEKGERERERARITEVELRGEQSMLETRVEALRARVEEASTGANGDAHAKLLRQIETLQTQYAVASENSQGIEGSLLTRVTHLEKERDELAKRESEIRRKAREVNLKSRRTEEELESSHRKFEALQQDLAERHEQLDKLQRRALDAESAMKTTREDFEREKQAWKADIANRIEQEKNKWREEIAAMAAQSPPSPYGLSPHLRTESPTGMGSNRKGSSGIGLDFLSLQPRRVSSRPISAEYVSNGGIGVPSTDKERPLNRSRQTSAQQVPQGQQRNYDNLGMTPPTIRQDSASSFSNGGPPALETPSIHTADQDSTFESHSSPHRTIADMISVSTVGAGPSVQLVERMSAAVRRLESEKAASKDELARLSGQRDEARGEVVALMREVEEKRAVDERVATLEQETRKMDERYQTTLEMLGEKSEMVEELKADVADVKKIYRELVDSTMK